MQPPALMPLIHGSTTPRANEAATAASIASPPASRIAAPTAAARLCCAATTPARVATTRLRTTCESEKLSFIGAIARDGRKILAQAAAGERLDHDAHVVRLPAHGDGQTLAHFAVAAVLPEALGARVARDDAEADPAAALRAEPRFQRLVQGRRRAAAVKARRHDEEADVPDAV